MADYGRIMADYGPLMAVNGRLMPRFYLFLEVPRVSRNVRKHAFLNSYARIAPGLTRLCDLSERVPNLVSRA